MRVNSKSLRARITLAAVTIVGTVLAVAAVLLFTVQRSQLIQNIDNSLDREAAEVVAAFNANTEAMMGERGDDRIVQIIDGKTIIDASSAELRSVRVIDPASIDIDEDDVAFTTLSAIPIEDDQYRLLVRRMQVRGQEAFVVVGENTDDLNDNLRTLAISIAIMVPIASALLGAVAWFTVGRTLSPVSSIQTQVNAISGDRRGERVPVPTTSDEIADLATTMNAMLDRIDHAQERQKSFVEDASHELRSPLTRLRTSLEVDLATTDRDLNQTGHELIGDLDDLQTIVNDLLFLARTGQQPTADPCPVDLDAVIDRVVDRLGQHSGISIDTKNVDPIEVTGNEVHLSRLLSNLVSNALRHADATVWITAKHEPDAVTVEVEDDGPGIALDDRARVFERFTRLDQSRTAKTGGSGLGLAIAKQIVESHNGTIAATAARTGGAKFTVRFTIDQRRS